MTPRRTRSASDKPPRRRRWRRPLRLAGVVALSLAGLLARLHLNQPHGGTGRKVQHGRLRSEGPHHRGKHQRHQDRRDRAGDRAAQRTGDPGPGPGFRPADPRAGRLPVIAVEGFGYGYSDMTARPRTVENISDELHEVLSTLGVRAPYILIGHSIAGFSTLYYANKYPRKCPPLIGIDPTVPASKSSSSGTTDPAETAAADYSWAHIPSTTGLVRWVTALGYGEPGGDSFTAAEREQMRQMTSWNFGNQAVTDETLRVGENAAKLQDVRYPDEPSGARLPVPGHDEPAAGLVRRARTPAGQRHAPRAGCPRGRALPALDAVQGHGEDDHRVPGPKRPRKSGRDLRAPVRRRDQEGPDR